MKSAPSPSAAFARRRRVHDAVRELMAEQGFRVSMGAVAARAGCSKQTLYAHFGSKQALIREVLQERMDITSDELNPDSHDPRVALLGFATDYLGRLSEPSVIAARRLWSAEAAQFPEEAQALYRDGMEALQTRLAARLEQAMERGQLQRAPAQPSAELLLGMLAGLDFERQRFTVAHRDSQSARSQWAAFAVDAFLRAFAPRRGA